LYTCQIKIPNKISRELKHLLNLQTLIDYELCRLVWMRMRNVCVSVCAHVEKKEKITLGCEVEMMIIMGGLSVLVVGWVYVYTREEKMKVVHGGVGANDGTKMEMMTWCSIFFYTSGKCGW